MNKEVDFALQYADERRMRINLERRLHSMMFNVFPFLTVSVEMARAVLAKDNDGIAENLGKLLNWYTDVEIDLGLQILHPVGTYVPMGDRPVGPPHTGSIGDVPDHVMTAAANEYEKSFKEVQKEWLALGYDSHDAIRRRGLEKSVGTLEETIKTLKREKEAIS